MNGLGVLERIGELARSGEAVRAGHGGLAAGTVVEQAGLARHHHRRRRAGRLDRRRLRGAGGDPRGEAGHRGRERPAAAARHPGPVRHGRSRGDDGRADLLPERGRPRGLHRAGAPGAAPGDRGRLADGAHARRAGPGTGLAHRPGRPRGVHGGSADGAVDGRRRHPGPRRRGHDRARGRHAPRLPGPGRVPQARRGGARLPRRAGRAQGPAGPGARARGLDLGKTTHEEMAVAILAELVQLRASGALARRGAPRPNRPAAGSDRTAAQARRGGRPGLRDDGHAGRLGPAARARRASPTTSAAPAAAGHSAKSSAYIKAVLR